MYVVHLANAVGWNEMPFSRDAHVVSSNIVLDRGHGLPTGRGDFGVGTPSQNCIANCGQAITDSRVVTMDNLYELRNALSNGTTTDPIPLPLPPK